MGKSKRGEKRVREEVPKKKQANFKKRKECILKKTMELSVLCDIPACAVIIDADGGEIATWPENRCEAMKVLDKYREQKVLENLLNEPWKEILNEVGVGDFKNVDDYQSLLAEVDAKLKALTERIEVLSKPAGDYQRIYPQPPAIAPPDVSYLLEGFSNQQSNFYIPDEVIVGAEKMGSADFDSLMLETNEFKKSAEGYQSIQVPVAYFLEDNQYEDGAGSSSNYSTQEMPIALPDMPYLFDQDFLNQFCSTDWNLENCFYQF